MVREMTENLVHCYNRGCSQMFDVDNNAEGSCLFHPGEPYFHDAYKEWPCCKRKTTDFTEFLSIKGCTEGKHNSNRPETLDKRKETNEDLMKTVENVFSTSTNINTISKTKLDSIDVDSPLVIVKPEISDRLLTVLPSLTKFKFKSDVERIPVGTPCKNASCKTTYSEVIDEKCLYHPGSAIFHEGMKYWSCCEKKTTDFTKFLDQCGCTEGTHLWLKEKEGVQCRVDWHQTATHVIVSAFAKNYDPYKSTVSLSPIRMKIYIVFPQDEQVFELEHQLFSVIDVQKSNVTMLSTKIELKLSKMFGDQWKDLQK